MSTPEDAADEHDGRGLFPVRPLYAEEWMDGMDRKVWALEKDGTPYELTYEDIVAHNAAKKKVERRIAWRSPPCTGPRLVSGATAGNSGCEIVARMSCTI